MSKRPCSLSISCDGVEGPCVRSWGNVAAPVARDLTGVAPEVVDTDVPFRVNPI